MTKASRTLGTIVFGEKTPYSGELALFSTFSLRHCTVSKWPKTKERQEENGGLRVSSSHMNLVGEIWISLLLRQAGLIQL